MVGGKSHNKQRQGDSQRWALCENHYQNKMKEDLKYPQNEAIHSVLRKIGVDPEHRCPYLCQDEEYTSCRVEELEKYFELYEQSDTSVYEKRVLGCYFMECLNELTEDSGLNHPLKNRIFKLMHRDLEIHESELEYWSNTEDPNPDHWWPITKEILSWKNT